MKEQMPIQSARIETSASNGLTNVSVASRLKRGDIFMPDGGQSPEITRTQTPVKTQEHAPAAKPLSQGALFDAWNQELTPHEMKSPHTRSTVQLLVERGVGPGTITSKGRIEQEAKDVLGNAMLNNLDEEQSAWVKTILKKEELSPEEEELIINLHKNRLAKAEGLLRKLAPQEHEELTAKQKIGILRAHYVGSDEIGKNGKAGVYNYTQEQISNKARILEEAGLSKDQRRVLMESGVTGNPMDTAPYTDPVIRTIVDEINMRHGLIGPAGSLGPHFIREMMQEVREIRREAAGAGNAARVDQAQTLIDYLNVQAATEGGREMPQGYWRALGEEDWELLSSANREDLDKFVNKWFDVLYSSARNRDASQSPGWDAVQTAEQEMSLILGTARQNVQNARNLEYVSDIFETRVRLLQMNSAISTKSIESIQKATYALQAHGLLSGASLDHGYTGAMYNRMTELLEDMRVKADRGHVTPIMIAELQRQLKEEAIGLSKVDGSIHHKPNKPEEDVEKDIDRAIRSAYDMLVDSQRLHVIAARGKQLLGTDAFFSDAGAVFRAFNVETFVSEKWGLLTATDQKYLDKVKEYMVNQHLKDKKDSRRRYDAVDKTWKELSEADKREFGSMLFINLSPPPDFFSSSWRIKGFQDQLSEYFTFHHGGDKVAGDQYAENFALFMRLKRASGEEDPIEKEKKILHAWDKINTYKSEEIVRLIRERLSPQEMDVLNKDIFKNMPLIKKPAPEHGREYFIPYGYDDFKVEFGAAMRAVREEWMNPPRNTGRLPEQVDFANMKPEQEARLAALLGVNGVDGHAKAAQLRTIYSTMQNYIRDNNIFRVKETGKYEGSLFDRDYRFSDLYVRVISVDDALMGRLENISDEERKGELISISQRWSNDLGGDSYVRTMNDAKDGMEHVDALIAHIKQPEEEKKLEAAMTAAEKAKYNGQGAGGEVLRYTMIPFLEMSMVPTAAEIIGINKLPFRLKMTEIERIYGPHAKPLNQEQRRHMFDKIEAFMEASIQAATNEANAKIAQADVDLSRGAIDQHRRNDLVHEAHESIHKAHHDAEKFKRQSEIALQIMGSDLMKNSVARVFLVIFITALVETMALMKEAGEAEMK